MKKVKVSSAYLKAQGGRAGTAEKASPPPKMPVAQQMKDHSRRMV